MIHVIAILKPLYLHIHATECCYVTVFSPPSKLIVYNIVYIIQEMKLIQTLWIVSSKTNFQELLSWL